MMSKLVKIITNVCYLILLRRQFAFMGFYSLFIPQDAKVKNVSEVTFLALNISTQETGLQKARVK